MLKYTKQVKAAQRIEENESKKAILSERRDFGDYNPVALERIVWQLFCHFCRQKSQCHQLIHNDMRSVSAKTYGTNYFQRLTLESWYTNLQQTPLNRR